MKEAMKSLPSKMAKDFHEGKYGREKKYLYSAVWLT